MKKTFTLIMISGVFISKADYWTQKADYGGGYITNAIAFTIGTKGYVGLGVDSLSTYHNDFWEYEPATNVWTQKANFTGTLRQGASAFSVGDTGYVGLGWAPSFLNDFWKYDAALNAWTQLTNFTGTERDFANAFTIDNKGYFTCGLGTGGPISDLWEYDPGLGTWTQKASIATAIFAAVSFVINGKAYVTTGFGPLSASEYDPVNNMWSPKTPLPFLLFSGSGFSIGDYGYVGTGVIDAGLNTLTKQFWQYNSISDSWTQKTDFGGTERSGGIGFSIAQKGYLGTGAASDFWEYTPDSTTGISDFGFTIANFTVYPNPAKNELAVTCNQLGVGKKVEITIRDRSGKLCLQLVSHLSGTPSSKLSTKIGISQFSKGIYFIKIDNGEEKVVKKFLKE